MGWWWRWMNWTIMGLGNSSSTLCTPKCPPAKYSGVLCLYCCFPCHNSLATWASVHCTGTANTAWRPPSAWFSGNQDSSEKRNLLKCARWRCARTPSRWTAVITVFYLLRMVSDEGELRRDVSDNLCWDSLVMQTSCCLGSLGSLSKLIMQVEKTDPGLVWLHVACGCEAGWMYRQILGNDVEGGLW